MARKFRADDEAKVWAVGRRFGYVRRAADSTVSNAILKRFPSGFRKSSCLGFAGKRADAETLLRMDRAA